MSIKRVEREDGPRYQVYVKHRGKKHYVGTYNGQRAAKDAEEDYRVTLHKIDAGELPPQVDLKRTLRTAVEEWLSSLDAQRSRSHDQYRVRMNAYILPSLGNVPSRSSASFTSRVGVTSKRRSSRPLL